jgi:OmpA-OmpF porin, OOP family
MKKIILTLSLVISQLTFANVLGDMQTFAPSSDGQDFITVHSARPLKKKFWAFSGYFNYAKDHLLVYDDMLLQTKQNYSDHLTEFDLDVAYGVSENFQLFFAAPALLEQASDRDMNPRISITRGVHSWRPGFKWTFSKDKDDYWAAVFSADIPNVNDNPYTGQPASNIYNLEISGTWKSGNYAKGFNIGYRNRKPGEIPADARMFPLKDQLTLSAGLSNAWSKSTRWVLEAFLSYPINKDPYKDAIDASSVDLLGGFKHRWVKNLNFDWGLTVEPGVKTQAPAWRVFTGLVYYWGPKEEVVKKEVKPVEDVPLQNDLDFLPPSSTSLDLPIEPDVKPVAALKVIPEYAEINEGSRLQLKPEGGITPYRYRIIEGGGRITETGLYRAPAQPSQVIVEVTDTTGQLKESKITVRAAPKPDKIIRLSNLKFKFNTDILIDSSKADLRKAISVLKEQNANRIIIEGHTDSIGDEVYNQELSEKRAEAVRNSLIRDLEINEANVEAIGFGEARPAASNDTPKVYSRK